MVVRMVLVHVGAGDIPDSRDSGKLIGCKLAARVGHQKLLETGSVLIAVEEAVKVMELDANFNAGYGSILDLNGDVVMEASIMDGRNLSAGCCTLVTDMYHPITLARLVKDETRHTFLGGENAMKFAREQGIEILPSGVLITDNAREALAQFKKSLEQGEDVRNAKTEIGHRDREGGTVGAVAIDAEGNVAAATSTGGITGKAPGRIGDTPIIGAGTYADNLFGAVSTTGHGETILRFNVAQRILSRIEFLQEDAQTATRKVLEEMTRRLTFTAGAITVDAKGEPGFWWSSAKMAWAYQRGNEVHSGIRLGDDFVEEVVKSTEPNNK